MSNLPEDFKAIRLKLASPKVIEKWSHGEVKKPETINYRTQRPEKDGLFSERIFGPTKDWECYCGKYKRIRYKGIVCDKCGVEVTRSIVRRERMGHIELAAPVSHIWFLRGVPSKIGMILDISARNLEKVIYFASYIVTMVDEEAREEVFDQLEAEFKTEKKAIRKEFNRKVTEIKQKVVEKIAGGENKKVAEEWSERKIKKINEARDKQIQKLNQAFSKAKAELSSIEKRRILSELEYRDLSMKYGQVFQAEIGAAAVRKLLEEIDLEEIVKDLEEQVGQVIASQRKKLKRRLNLVKSFINAGIRPEWMVLQNLPVIPPDLRPMVQLDGGRFAASDLNDLYRRVINRNNRLKRLIELDAPEVICRNEKRMLQEAVDALIDNSARHGKAAAVSTAQKRLLRSLADMLKGKQGRFRQNLLGKRVDYSGRSVIVVGPSLKLNECGIPKIMALELFKPFVINKLIENEYAHNVRSVNKLIEDEKPEVWDMLEEVIKDHYVLLNRAPTLHRLGIQAFHPVLIEGKAIQIHPMVCTAFNADFDGDQMAVHVPLTEGAKAEAKEIISSHKNLLKPATGNPISSPTIDIVLGCYYITRIKGGVKGEGKVFRDFKEALYAFEAEIVDIRAKIKVIDKNGDLIETCVGRIILNNILPDKVGYVNHELDKKGLADVLARCIEKCGRARTIKVIDKIKEIGFGYLTRTGISWGMDDLQVPKEKKSLINKAQERVEEVRQQYKAGLLTDDERYRKVVEIWANVKDEITDVSTETLDKFGSVYMMVESKARGSWPQIVQMMGMRGLMAAPSGKTIELPVRDSFKEGLGVLEYFISTHGARKGLSDTALRTANAGYLTRRLIDVAQDVVIREKDCGTEEGIVITQKESKEMSREFSDGLKGRTLMKDLKDDKGELIANRNDIIDNKILKKIVDADVKEVWVRSVLTCKTKRGVCSKCYGWDLGHNSEVKKGEAVGIVAAQSIGEPGTQLTMRTFHTGGVASTADITQGLPRVEELFEARGIKNPALIAELDGVIHVEEESDEKVIRIISQSKEDKSFYQKLAGYEPKVKDGEEVRAGKVLLVSDKGKSVKAEFSGRVKLTKQTITVKGEGYLEKEYRVPKETVLWVEKGDLVVNGQQITDGHLDIQNLMRVSGRIAVQKYVLKEVQSIYSSQGQDVNDKHIEIIIRQMFSKVRIKKAGDSSLLEGMVVDRAYFEEMKEKMEAKKKEIPVADDVLLGITKSSLSTESFLSAASFQETAKVLIDAAVTGKVDELRGLKENVIIGKPIPVGSAYRD